MPYTWKLYKIVYQLANGNLLMAQETQTGALYQSRGVGWGGRWERGSEGRGYMYTYGWLMLRFDRKQQNSVKQLSFSKKKKKKKKKKTSWLKKKISWSKGIEILQSLFSYRLC